MPNLDLAPIKARVGATPEPWEVFEDRQGLVLRHGVRHLYVSDFFTAEEIEFLVHARADIPNLIAEVEKLRTDRERLQRLYHMALHDILPGGGTHA